MQDKSDAELLRDYAERRYEPAFREIVARHTDLVYSAALRQVRSCEPAREVAQSVFTDLARKAGALVSKMGDKASLAGWLYRSTRFASLNQLRGDRRRLTNEREAMEQLTINSESAPDWKAVRPVLDEVMEDLNDEDREALLLRFFKNQDLRTVGAALGVTDDAAQKRVSRALEKLRGHLASRGVAATGVALSTALATSAVQAVPAGLALAISAAAVAAEATLATAASATAAKTIAMTTLQKALVTAVILAAVATGIYESRTASHLRDEVRELRQRQVEQTRRSEHERQEAESRLAVLGQENSRLKVGQNSTELLKLRGEVGVLRQQLAVSEAKARFPAIGRMLSDPAMRDWIRQTALNTIRSHFGEAFKELKLTPEQTEKVVQVMGDVLLRNTEKMYALPQGKLSAAEIAQASAEREAGFKAELQPLLGQAGFARFKEFQEEIPAHATVALLNGQLGASQLSDAEVERLVKVVKAEPFALTRGISGDWDPAFWGVQEDIDKHLAKVAESNERIAEQASSFLTPVQLAALNNVLTNAVNERIAQAAAMIQKQ